MSEKNIPGIDYAKETVERVFMLHSRIGFKEIVEQIEKKAQTADATPEEKGKEKVIEILKAKGQINELQKQLPTLKETVGFLVTKERDGTFHIYHAGHTETENAKPSQQQMVEKKLPNMLREVDTGNVKDAAENAELETNWLLNTLQQITRAQSGDPEQWFGAYEWHFQDESPEAEKKARKYRQFDMLFPALTPSATPLEIAAEKEQAQKISKEKRAELVARYGEQAIKDLECNIKSKSKKSSAKKD